MIKAWTYESAPSAGLYWQSQGIPVILVENAEHRLEWRRVSDGELHAGSTANHYHKEKELPRTDYPQWLQDMDEMGMDEGL